MTVYGRLIMVEEELFLERELDDGVLSTVLVTQIEYDESTRLHYRLEPIIIDREVKPSLSLLKAVDLTSDHSDLEPSEEV